MDIQFFGLNLAVVIMIVGMTEKIKDFVTISDKRWFTVISFGFSVLASFGITQPFGWVNFAFNSLMYFSFSTLFYDTIIKYIEKKKEELTTKQ